MEDLTNFISEYEISNYLNELNVYVQRHVGGLPSSEINSTQQWDFPNVWPPSQFIIIEGLWSLDASTFPQAPTIAKNLAYKLLDSSYCAFIETQAKGEAVMFEKYNSQ